MCYRMVKYVPYWLLSFCLLYAETAGVFGPDKALVPVLPVGGGLDLSGRS